jgi:hypothetical protein
MQYRQSTLGLAAFYFAFFKKDRINKEHMKISFFKNTKVTAVVKGDGSNGQKKRDYVRKVEGRACERAWIL